LEVKHLQDLLVQLSRENLMIFENNQVNKLSSSSELTNLLVMQPYQALVNLEKIMAIATLLEVIPAEDLSFKKSELATTYRNQVTNVLKEANFAALIRQTVTFMYATSETNNLIA